MKTLGNIIIFILTMLIALSVDFYGVYVVLSIAKLYSLLFITQFNLLQIFGLWILISVFSYKYKKTEDMSYEEAISGTLNMAFWKAFYFTVSWGIAFLIFNILN